MKHHIAVKFLAVLLATLSLFGAIASGLGVFVLTALDLYENSVDDLYEENMENTRRHFAVNLVHRYASLHLGELPEDYLNQYYGTHWQYDTFEYGCYFYTIRNEKGEIVEDTATDLPKDAVCYRIQVTEVNYRDLVKTVPYGTASYPQSPAEAGMTEAPAEEGAAASSIPATEAPTEESAPATSIPATEAPTEEPVPNTSIPATEEPTEEHAPSTSAPTEEVSETTQPETTPEETTPPVETQDAVDTIPTEEALPKAASTDIAIAPTESWSNYLDQDTYYDHSSDQQMTLYYTIQELPPYTVELYLLPGAAPVEHMYSLLRSIWTYRNELFYVLGISILLFAVFAVYLCCAAGKKPGREEIRAGGFNCIPLDLYLGAGGMSIAVIIVFGYEVTEYLLRTSPKILAPIMALAGLGCCLIFVGFCFACAAQFKTPGLYWWHNSITGRCWKLLVILCRWSIKAFLWFMHWLEVFLGKSFPLLGKAIRVCWNGSIRLIVTLFRWTDKSLTWLGHAFGRLMRKFFTLLHRFLVLLPVTWQWLLAGGMLLFFLVLSVLTRSEGVVMLTVLAGIALVVYGAHCFGVLMESTKHMSKGDLETKVDDKLMIGAFREFAGDLNALADVAMVAAQKQMKSERMKTELITNVSHDIKTPLTSIINYVDLLQRAETEEDKEVCLEVLSRQSMQLKKLIEDLIEMSKASTGNMSVEITSVDAAEAINQALGEFSDKLDRAQLTPVFRQPESPIHMMADGRLAWRVMSNLLSNAVKYALPGTRVYIDLMELEGKVIISMKNISREELNVSADELLERFVRGDASRNTEGSGLGLNIAKSLMDIQKGQLQLLVDGDLFKVTLVFPSADL